VANTESQTIPTNQLLSGRTLSKNSADGADFDFNSHGVTLGLSHPLPKDAVIEAYYSHSFNDYDNPNSLAGPAGFAFARDDDVDRLTARLLIPITDPVHLHLRFDFIDNDSNIKFFKYDQHVLSAGLVVQF